MVADWRRGARRLVHSPLGTCSVVSIQGSSPHNEDIYVCDEQHGLYAVVDGATALSPYRGLGGESSGFLAARLVADVLMRNERQGANSSLPLDALLRQANDELGRTMLSAAIDVSCPLQLWGACVVAVRLHFDYLEVAQIGDAVLALVNTDGNVTLATPNQLAGVSRITRARCHEANERKFSSAGERLAFIRQGLLANRQLANIPNGYGVLNGQKAAENFIVSQRIPLQNVQAMLLMTDGLAFPGAKNEDELGVVEAVSHVQRMGLVDYARWLVEQEQADSACLRFPRAKVSDDKTGIWLEAVGR